MPRPARTEPSPPSSRRAALCNPIVRLRNTFNQTRLRAPLLALAPADNTLFNDNRLGMERAVLRLFTAGSRSFLEIPSLTPRIYRRLLSIERHQTTTKRFENAGQLRGEGFVTERINRFHHAATFSEDVRNERRLEKEIAGHGTSPRTLSSFLPPGSFQVF